MAQRSSSPRHPVGPDEIRRSTGPDQVDLGFAVAEDVDVCRLMIVGVDDDAQAIGTQHSNYGT